MSSSMIWYWSQTMGLVVIHNGTISEFRIQDQAVHTASTLSTCLNQTVSITMECSHLCIPKLKLRSLEKAGIETERMFAIIKIQWKERLKEIIILWLSASSFSMKMIQFILHTLTRTLFQTCRDILIGWRQIPGKNWGLGGKSCAKHWQATMLTCLLSHPSLHRGQTMQSKLNKERVW